MPYTCESEGNGVPWTHSGTDDSVDANSVPSMRSQPMSAPALTLIEARTANLELRKRVVKTVDDLDAIAPDGERDAVLVMHAGVPVPDDSALLDALTVYVTQHEAGVFTKVLQDVDVVVVDVAMGTRAWVAELKAQVRKAPGVLFISGRLGREADLGLMSKSFRQGSFVVKSDAPDPMAGLGLGAAVAEGIPSPTVPATPAADRRARGGELARNRRNDLLAQERWVSSQEAAEQARGRTVESNPYEYASRLRRELRLFGARFGGRYLYPAFQFLPDTGEPHPALRDLIPLLPDSNDGWTAAFWLFEPSGRLQGARPADVFLEDPASVIAAAQRDFQGDDESW